ncbi:MAG: sugar phosphate isomerase/epimerase family protein [Planctomycetaceae bacterium]
MKLGLINSAWAQAGRDTAWGIRKTREIGFDCIDIFTDPLDIDVRERKLIRTECQASGLPIVSVCCVATGLIDFNPSVQRFHISRCRAFLDLCCELEAENLLLVLGEYIWQKEVIPAQEQWQTGVRNCRILAEYAQTLGLKIALELEPFHLSVVNDIDTMVQFVDQVDHPAFRANIDVSHLVLAGVAADAMPRLAGKAIHVHLSDCDGKVHGDLPPGRGVVNFAPYLQQIAELKIDGAVSIELEYSPDPDNIEAWVREAYESTATLLAAAGLREHRRS